MHAADVIERAGRPDHARGAVDPLLHERGERHRDHARHLLSGPVGRSRCRCATPIGTPTPTDSSRSRASLRDLDRPRGLRRRLARLRELLDLHVRRAGDREPLLAGVTRSTSFGFCSRLAAPLRVLRPDRATRPAAVRGRPTRGRRRRSASQRMMIAPDLRHRPVADVLRVPPSSSAATWSMTCHRSRAP